MLKRYENFLKEFDKVLTKHFKSQSEYIKCQKGCSKCCEKGDYPFSRLEMEYLMSGFQKLTPEIQNTIKDNIKKIKDKNDYKCPFLVDNLCSLYKYRGLVCRTYGLAYLQNGIVKLPKCAEENLNYSEIYNLNTKEIIISDPIQENLSITGVFQSPLAKQYDLQCGEIRKLIDWLIL